LYSTAKSSSDFHSALNHNKDLLIFSKSRQYKLSGAVALTPQTAGMPVTSAYTNSPLVKPLSLGKDVYFQFNYGNAGSNTGISRYKSTDSTDNPDRATPITEYVKKYIPTGTDVILGDANIGNLYAINYTTSDIFVCNYDSDEDSSRRVEERLAWSKWTLDIPDLTRILNVAIVEGDLHFVVLRGLQLDLLKIQVVENPTEINRFSLDYMVETETALSGIVVMAPAGYPTTDVANAILIVNDPESDRYGEELEHIWVGDRWSLTTQDLPTSPETPIAVGHRFASEFSPQTVHIKDESGKVNSNTNLRILKWLAHMEESADVWAKIETPYYTIPDQFWSGLIANDLHTRTDEVANNTSVFDIAYRQRADLAVLSLYTDSHLPMHVTNVEWQGTYTSRGRRF